MRLRLPFVAVGALSLALGVAACSDDDDSTPNPTPTATSSASPSVHLVTYDLTCPDPLGSVTVKVNDTDDEWSPAYVVGTKDILDPVAFGEVTFTPTDTGATQVVQPPSTKPGADTSKAVGPCSFTRDVPAAENPDGSGAGTINGTVTVVPRD